MAITNSLEIRNLPIAVTCNLRWIMSDSVSEIVDNVSLQSLFILNPGCIELAKTCVEKFPDSRVMLVPFVPYDQLYDLIKNTTNFKTPIHLIVDNPSKEYVNTLVKISSYNITFQIINTLRN